MEKAQDEEFLKRTSLARINSRVLDPAMTAVGVPRPKGATAKPEGGLDEGKNK